jgi:hypothetical protein
MESTHFVLFCIVLHVPFLLCPLLLLLLLVQLTLLFGTNKKISRWWRTEAPCHKQCVCVARGGGQGGMEENEEGRNRECSESRQTNWHEQSPDRAKVSNMAMLARARGPTWHCVTLTALTWPSAISRRADWRD